jgi:hypothetical protein
MRFLNEIVAFFAVFTNMQQTPYAESLGTKISWLSGFSGFWFFYGEELSYGQKIIKIVH